MPLPDWFWDNEQTPEVVHLVVPLLPREPDKQSILAQMLSMPAGRQRLAASMTQPLRAHRHYAAVGRKTFLVESLPEGALPIYDKDP